MLIYIGTVRQRLDEELEVGERTFTMSQVSADYWKITSGLFIRPDHEGRGLGTILVGLTNKVIQDMIARHLRNEPNTRVYAFLEDGSTASNQHLDYSGWTSFHAKKLGFYPLKNKQYDPLFMKRFPVKQILANSVNAQPTLSTPHPHHQV
jgi:GNAT superfamily N-acetyltransferase